MLDYRRGQRALQPSVDNVRPDVAELVPSSAVLPHRKSGNTARWPASARPSPSRRNAARPAPQSSPEPSSSGRARIQRSPALAARACSRERGMSALARFSSFQRPHPCRGRGRAFERRAAGRNGVVTGVTSPVMMRGLRLVRHDEEGAARRQPTKARRWPRAFRACAVRLSRAECGTHHRGEACVALCT